MLIVILLSLISLFFPVQLALAQESDPFTKLNGIANDFAASKFTTEVKVDPNNFIVIPVKVSNSTESVASDYDDKIGGKITQVTISNPDNRSQSVTLPLNQSQSIPLSAFRTGVALMITPPSVSPPSLPSIGLSDALTRISGVIESIPEWVKQKVQSGGNVEIKIERLIQGIGNDIVGSGNTIDHNKLIQNYSPPGGIYPINASTGKPATEVEYQQMVANAARNTEQKLATAITTQTPARQQAQGPPTPGMPGGPSVAPAPAATPCTGANCSSGGGIPCGVGREPAFKTAIGCIHTNPVEFVKDFMTFLLAISGGLAFLMMLLGAFQMLTSAGNPDALNSGKERLTSAIIGLLFVIFATLLMQVIGISILNIPGFKP